MTDEQFKRLLEIGYSQLALLKQIEANTRASNKAPTDHNWDDVSKMIENAEAYLKQHPQL